MTQDNTQALLRRDFENFSVQVQNLSSWVFRARSIGDQVSLFLHLNETHRLLWNCQRRLPRFTPIIQTARKVGEIVEIEGRSFPSVHQAIIELAADKFRILTENLTKMKPFDDGWHRTEKAHEFIATDHRPLNRLKREFRAIRTVITAWSPKQHLRLMAMLKQERAAIIWPKVTKLKLSESEQNLTPTESRNEYIYARASKGDTWDLIRLNVKKNKEWEPLLSINGVKFAAIRYAERNELPPLKPRQRRKNNPTH